MLEAKDYRGMSSYLGEKFEQNNCDTLYGAPFVYPKIFCAKIFDTKIVVAKIFCIKIFCNTVCTFIFDSKETTHAKINVQNFVKQKKLMQNFLSQKKTRAKINRQKYLTI